MNAIAERYVHLVLALGQHDPDYVDAYYGPPEWKKQSEEKTPLVGIALNNGTVERRIQRRSVGIARIAIA